MADTKISAFTPATSLGATDIVPIVQGGTNKSATTNVITSSVTNASGLNVTAPVNFLGSLTASSPLISNSNVTLNGISVATNGLTVTGSFKATGSILFSGVVGVTGSTSLFGQLSITGTLFGDGISEAKNFADPSLSQSLTNKQYVDYPIMRTVALSSTVVTSSDFGRTILFNFSGACTGTLPNLSSGFPGAKTGIIMFILQSTGSNLTIIPSGSGVTLNGTGSSFTLGITAGLFTVATPDGLNWFK